VAHVYNLSLAGGMGRRIMIQSQLGTMALGLGSLPLELRASCLLGSKPSFLLGQKTAQAILDHYPPILPPR
jgi:proteasome assembly chaperone (PAC2) family protein